MPDTVRIPCMDWSCRREHETLRTGPVFASFHVRPTTCLDQSDGHHCTLEAPHARHRCPCGITWKA